MKALSALYQTVLGLTFVALFLSLLPAGQAGAAERRFIRDTEIENIIRDFVTPVFQAAGLNPRAVDVYLIQDDSLNAFVSGGQNIFIHTGLLMATEDPAEIIGVLAHETGHIAGGHLARGQEQLQGTQAQVLASYALGLGAAIATGQPGLASAIISGGQDVALKGLLSFSRTQESAADQAAVKYLKATGQSPQGLLSFMDKLKGQEVFLATNQDPYLRTHPLTAERINFLENQVANSPYKGEPVPPDMVALHERMKAKLIGFLQPQNRVMKAYPESDQSVNARYARAIAFYRQPDLDKALSIVDGLIQEAPNDPYFHELKGQILFENGRIAEALQPYQKAVELLPDAGQITMSLARVEIELNDPALSESAEQHLRTTLRDEPNNAAAWRLMAIVYGRRGDEGMTSLALAEAAMARRQVPEALQHARRATDLLPENSPGWLRAQDLQNLAEREHEQRQ